MSGYALTHLSDPTLVRDFLAVVSRENGCTALMLAYLGEMDARRLYAPAGYPSMFAWLVEEVHLGEETACKRIRAARTARQFPAIFELLAQGRLHLTAVVLLAPHLTPKNADELLGAAVYQSRAGIERLLAKRFPRPDLPTRIEPLGPAPASALPSPGTVDGTKQPSPGTTHPAPANSLPSPGTAKSKVAPLAPERYALQLTIGRDTHDKLRYAQALLGHTVPCGELAEVFERALDALIARLERQKFATTERPRRCRASENPRQIPASVRRAVWERDGGQCTFVSESRHRCEARSRLEFDHVEPVAKGGRATAMNLRLRCRGHNQYAAERAFGRDFMRRKHETAQRAAEPARARAAAEAEEARVRAAAAAEVIPWLRALGLRADEARRAAARCEAIPDIPLEERVRYALSGLARPARGHTAASPRPAP